MALLGQPMGDASARRSRIGALKAVFCRIKTLIMARLFRTIFPQEHAHQCSTSSCHSSPSQLHGAVLPRRCRGSRCEWTRLHTKRPLGSPSQRKSPDEQQGTDCTEGFAEGLFEAVARHGDVFDHVGHADLVVDEAKCRDDAGMVNGEAVCAAPFTGHLIRK